MKYQLAYEIANNILQNLLPTKCTHAFIAGSIRRHADEVKDIEIVCLPNIVPLYSNDLFKTELGKVRDENFVKYVSSLGVILKGKPETGRYVQIALLQNINLDLFIPQPHDFYRILAIRTGSADYSHFVIAKGWENKGWCGTPEGLRLQREC